MDEKLKQLIIDAFNHGIRHNKNKGHWITPLDFIEENKEQLRLYSVSKRFDNKTINKIRNSKSDAEARRIIKEFIEC